MQWLFANEVMITLPLVVIISEFKFLSATHSRMGPFSMACPPSVGFTTRPLDNCSSGIQVLFTSGTQLADPSFSLSKALLVCELRLPRFCARSVAQSQIRCLPLLRLRISTFRQKWIWVSQFNPRRSLGRDDVVRPTPSATAVVIRYAVPSAQPLF